MKKLVFTFLVLAAFATNANALSPERSREEARFLTDKMAYELDLTDDQLQDIYEINYDYFRSLGPVNLNYDNSYNLRYEYLGYVLSDWQWREFLLRDYFLRPAYIYHGAWAFGIYNYYALNHFYYGIPHCYHHYHGGHFGHRDYYRGRMDMHHRSIAARPSLRGHRSPDMIRPNVRGNRDAIRGGERHNSRIADRNTNRKRENLSTRTNGRDHQYERGTTPGERGIGRNHNSNNKREERGSISRNSQSRERKSFDSSKVRTRSNDSSPRHSSSRSTSEMRSNSTRSFSGNSNHSGHTFSGSSSSHSRGSSHGGRR